MSGPHPDPGQNRVAPRGIGLGVARLRAALTALSAALLASYFVLVLLQIFFRYVLNESLFWAEELVRGLMVWGVMIGSALVAASRDHIRVEVLELMLPPIGRRIVVRIANVLCIAFSLILLWAAIQLMDRSWFQQSPLLQVPKWTVYMAIAVGAALEALLMLFTWNQQPRAESPLDPSL